MHPLRASRRKKAQRNAGTRRTTVILMSSFSQPDTDLVVPAFDVRALARRAAVPAGLAAAAAAAIVVAGGPLQAFAHALRRALDADPRWVIGGAVFELLSFAGYVALLWLVGSRATDAARAAREHAGHARRRGRDAAAADRRRRRRGADAVGAAARRAGRARRDAHAARLPRRPVLGLPRRHRRRRAALIALGLVARRRAARAERHPRRGRHAGHRRPRWPSARAVRRPRRARAARACTRRADVLGAAVRDAIGLVRSADPRLLGAARLVGVRRRRPVGDAPRVRRAARRSRVVVLAYFVGQVGNTIPIPGAVSGGIVGVLLAFGVAGRPGARLRARLPRDRDLAARADRPRRPRLAAPDDRALERRGRSAREPSRAAPAPVARTPRPCSEPALLAA